MKIILFNPEIPQNTGNIIRTCSLTNTKLILVKPLGFSLSGRMVKRSGMDYIKDANIEIIEDLEEFLKKLNNFYFFSTKVKKRYTDISYTKDCSLIFGSESSGLSPQFFKKHPHHFATIPMQNKKRSLNLANAVSIVLYEALRQQNFTF